MFLGKNRAYGEYSVTFNQSFLTTRPESFEEDVHYTWFQNKPSTEEMACMVVTGTTGGKSTIEKNAYFVVFQRGLEKSKLSFEKYHGIYHEIHSNQKKYVPKLLDANTEDNLCEFETRFVQQWNFLRTRYNSIFHGFLSFSISFGTFYVMNIESNSRMNVSKLNDLFNTINERKKARQTATKHDTERTHVSVPYIFSFQPTAFSSTTKLHRIIEQFGFTRDSDETKKTTLVKFKYPDVGMHNFDENGELNRIGLSQNKWFMATVLPAQSSAQLTSIRYGLKSYRNVERENISNINLKLLETGTDEYQIKPSCDIHRAIKKVSELYSVSNWFGEKKVKLNIKTTTELKGDAKKLVPCSSSNLEVLVLPEIPNIDTCEEELRSYARHIWKWAIEFAEKLKLASIPETDLERENTLPPPKNT